MTPADLARAARIAAYRFAYGASVAEAERTLLSYMPAIGNEDLQRALYYGRLVQQVGEQMTGGFEAQAEATLEEIYGQFQGGTQALIRYRVGPNDGQDWKTTILFPGTAATPESIRKLAEDAVKTLLTGTGEGGYNLMPEWSVGDAVASIEYTYIGPTGLGAL